MVLHWPQIVFLVWMFVCLLVHFNKHGQPRNTKWNFGMELLDDSIIFFLLYAGGFFGGK